MLHEGSEHIFFWKDLYQFEEVGLILDVMGHFNGDPSVAIVDNALELFLAKGDIRRHILLDNCGKAELHIHILEDSYEVHEEDVVVIELTIDFGADIRYFLYLLFAFLADLCEGTVRISELLLGGDVLYRFHEDDISASDDLEDTHVQFNCGEVFGDILNLLEDFEFGGEGVAGFEVDIFEVDENLFDGDIFGAA